MIVVPGVFIWLGYPTPPQGIATIFTAVFGESNGFNGVLAFIIVGALNALIILGATKLRKKMDESV